jgi:hypothetical protein
VRDVALSIGVAVNAAGAAFASPADVWLIMGLGLGALLPGYAIAKAWQQGGAPVPA